MTDPDFDPNSPDRVQRLVLQDLNLARKNAREALRYLARAGTNAKALDPLASFTISSPIADCGGILSLFLEDLGEHMLHVEEESLPRS